MSDFSWLCIGFSIAIALYVAYRWYKQTPDEYDIKPKRKPKPSYADYFESDVQYRPKPTDASTEPLRYEFYKQLRGKPTDTITVQDLDELARLYRMSMGYDENDPSVTVRLPFPITLDQWEQRNLWAKIRTKPTDASAQSIKG